MKKEKKPWTRFKIKKRKGKKSLLLIEERHSFLINELTKEENNRNESFENFQKIIDSDKPKKIQDSLKDEQIEMNENDNALNTRINEETQRLVELIMNEKNKRKDGRSFIRNT